MGPTYTTTVDLSTSNGSITVANVSGASSQLTAVSFLSGPQGPAGATGATGAAGAAGVGVPAGGTAGQYLRKTSGTDYADAWANLAESDVANLVPDLAAKAPALNPTAIKTSAYTLAANDFVPVDTTAGAVTLTLPSAPGNGTRVGAKLVIQGGTNTVTITRGGTDVFNKAGGNTSVTLTVLNQGVQFQYYNGIWYGTAADIGLTALDARYAPITGIPESSITNLTTDLAAKQQTLTLTTTGTSGAATLASGTLNIPQYSGGAGGITKGFAIAMSVAL